MCTKRHFCPTLKDAIKSLSHEQEKGRRLELAGGSNVVFHCTRCSSITLDFILMVSQLNSQTQVRNTDITCRIECRCVSCCVSQRWVRM